MISWLRAALVTGSIALVSALVVSLLLIGGDAEVPWYALAGSLSVIAALSAVILVCLAGWDRARSDARAAAASVKALAAGDAELARRLAAGARGSLAVSLREAASAQMQLRTDSEEGKAAFARVLNGVGEGILAIDRRRRIALVNDSARALFGVQDRESCIGRPFIEIVRNETLAQAFDRTLGGGEEVRVNALVQSHGFDQQIEMRVFPVAGSPLIAAVALLIDVTQIEKLQRMRRDFIADFSHEVRTPLAGLRLAVESLDGGVSAEHSEHLHRIVRRQIRRLERLVSDLAQLNEIESGEAVLQLEQADLFHIVTDVCDDFREKAQAAGVDIRIEGSAVPVRVDVVKIQQVFSNLVDNALKHAGDADRVSIAIAAEGEDAVVRITDYGAGIAPEEQPRIFHRFYRVDKSRSAHRGEGSGLGLAIAKHLVLRHGGRIGVESNTGRGATFWVALPLLRR